MNVIAFEIFVKTLSSFMLINVVLKFYSFDSLRSADGQHTSVALLSSSSCRYMFLSAQVPMNKAINKLFLQLLHRYQSKNTIKKKKSRFWQPLSSSLSSPFKLFIFTFTLLKALGFLIHSTPTDERYLFTGNKNV